MSYRIFRVTIETLCDLPAIVRARMNGRCCDDSYAVGGPVFDLDGEPMRRCSLCGLPRGTFRHGIKCAAGLCSDPDARSK